MAGKLGSRYHSTTGFSHGSKLSIAYQILEVLSFCARERAYPPSIEAKGPPTKRVDMYYCLHLRHPYLSKTFSIQY